MEQTTDQNVRIDKWLWAVRLYKTRSQATEACKNGKVEVNGMAVKPSYHLKTGTTVAVKSPFITRTYWVKGLLEKRVSAKIAVDFVEETTAPEEIQKLETLRNNPFGLRDRGMGRPTKKDRRDISRLKDIFQ